MRLEEEEEAGAVDAIVERDREDYGILPSDEEEEGEEDEEEECEEEEEQEEDEVEEEAGPSTATAPPAKKRPRSTKTTTFTRVPILPDTTPTLGVLKAINIHGRAHIEIGAVFERAEGVTPLSCFKKFFTNAAVDNIVKESNEYARLQGHALKLDAPTFYKWLGVVFIRAIRRPRRTRQLWSADPHNSFQGIGRIMSRDRFLNILRFLHVNDTSKDKETDVKADNLYRVRPLLETVLTTCMSAYVPSKEVSIDEMTVPFKGRCKHLQLFKSKPHGSGGALRVDALCSADTGYCYAFVFEADNTRAQKTGTISPLGSRTLWLAEQLPQTLHYIYMDNLYVTEWLLESLRDRGHYALGTCRHPPKAVKQERVAKDKLDDVRGTLKIALNTTKTVAAFSYYDKSPVHMMTTYRASFEPSIAPRTQRERPQALTDYNNFMNGVDRNDQYRWQHPCYIKSMKWWKAVFFFLVDLSLINSFLLYKNRPTVDPNARYTLADYRVDLIAQLVPDEPEAPLRPGPRQHNHHYLNRRAERHFLVPNSDLDAKGNPKTRWCARDGCGSRSSFVCEKCERAFCFCAARQCFNYEHCPRAEMERF